MGQPMYTRSLHIQMHHNQEKLDKVMAEVQDLKKMLQAARVWEKCWVLGSEEWHIMEEKGSMQWYQRVLDNLESLVVLWLFELR